eukprot:762406-Hanusia_phi.AAC.1
MDKEEEGNEEGGGGRGGRRDHDGSQCLLSSRQVLHLLLPCCRHLSLPCSCASPPPALRPSASAVPVGTAVPPRSSA